MVEAMTLTGQFQRPARISLTHPPPGDDSTKRANPLVEAAGRILPKTGDAGDCACALQKARKKRATNRLCTLSQFSYLSVDNVAALLLESHYFKAVKVAQVAAHFAALNLLSPCTFSKFGNNVV